MMYNVTSCDITVLEVVSVFLECSFWLPFEFGNPFDVPYMTSSSVPETKL